MITAMMLPAPRPLGPRTRNSDSHASIRMSLIIHEMTPRVRRHVILSSRYATCECNMAEITICQRCWKENERSLETTKVCCELGTIS